MRLGFLFFLLLPLAAQVYVMWRMYMLLPFPWWGRAVVVLLMTLAFVLFFLAVMPQLDRLPMPVATAVYHVGTSWPIMLLYLLMLFLLLDLLRLCHVLPTQFLQSSWAGTAVVTGLMMVLFSCGYALYLNKVRVREDLTTEKTLFKQGGGRPLRIVMTSDWHLGYHNRKRTLANWIDLINAEEPDLILIAGDIIDRSIRPLEEEQMSEEFRRLQAPVYACLGNHEYFSGKDAALRFYEDAGIHLLQDRVARFQNITIIGRDDRMNPRRKSLKTLIKDVSPDSYIILLDHQPYHLEEAEAAGVDFELCGHTHHGQVWPVNWITDALYECAFGSYRRGQTRYYISSGLGIWGGKFRIGTSSEYVVAELRQSQ